jgi:hypothetical protein
MNGFEEDLLQRNSNPFPDPHQIGLDVQHNIRVREICSSNSFILKPHNIILFTICVAIQMYRRCVLSPLMFFSDCFSSQASDRALLTFQCAATQLAVFFHSVQVFNPIYLDCVTN